MSKLSDRDKLGVDGNELNISAIYCDYKFQIKLFQTTYQMNR